MFKQTLCALALCVSAASAQAGILLQEDFDNVGGLAASGWVQTNASTPIGLNGWFQGDQNIFTAQAGAPQAYVAANFNNAAPGGTINNWLITPVFSTATDVLITFWARADGLPGFSDQFAYGASSGGSALSDFVLGAAMTAPGADWQEYSFVINAGGAASTARFAIRYLGDADSSNYIGFDTLQIKTVPEPVGLLLVATGLLGLGLYRPGTRARRPEEAQA